jgi:hypothetical protein
MNCFFPTQPDRMEKAEHEEDVEARKKKYKVKLIRKRLNFPLCWLLEIPSDSR